MVKQYIVGGIIMILPIYLGNTFKQSQPKVERISKPPKQINSLVQALIQVESSNNDSCIGDKHMGMPSIGCLQIRPIMVREVNRILKIQQNPKRFKNKDRWSRGKSIEIFNIWKNYHHKNSTDEVIARCWNGGPKGFKKSKTLRYWKKVQLCLKGKFGN